MASPGAGGFLGGLLEGAAGALYEHEKQQRIQQIDNNKILSSVLLKGLDADPTRETASAVLPVVAQLFAPHISRIQSMLGGKANDKTTGQAVLSAFSGAASAFPTRDELDTRAAKTVKAKAAAEGEGSILGRAQGEIAAMQHMVDFGQAKDIDDAAFKLFGRQRRSPTGLKYLPGTVSTEDILKGDKNPVDLEGKSFVPEPGLFYQRVQLPLAEGATSPDIGYIVGAPPKKATGSDANDFLKLLSPTVKARVEDRFFAAGGTPEQLADATKDSLAPFLKSAGTAGVKADETKETNASELAAIKGLALATAQRNAQTEAAAAGRVFDSAPPDPATANRVNTATGMTPNAEYQGALEFAMTNRMPSLGLGSAAQVRNARNAIQNKAAAIVGAAGTNLPSLQAEYAANKKALDQLVPRYNLISSAATTAESNLGLAEGQSAKVPRTGSPLVNRFVQWANGQKLTGNPALTEFEVYIYTAAREYARVTTGQTGAAGLTDTANKKAGELLNAAQTPQAFAAAVKAMRADMKNVTKGLGSQIAGVSKGIAGLLGVPASTATDQSPAPSGSSNRIYYDANGNPIKR